MTQAERDLLLFLVMNLRNELVDYEYRPSRAELRQRLDELIEKLRVETKAGEP